RGRRQESCAWLEGHPERGLERAHGLEGRGQAELRASDQGVVGGEGDVIEHVGGINAQVAGHMRGQVEAALQGGIHGELARTLDRVAAGGSPLPGDGRGEGGGIDEQPGRGGVRICAGGIGPHAGEAGAGHGDERGRSQRQAAAGGELRGQRPTLEQRTAPAPHQYSAATLRLWRWSKLERARSASSASQFWATTCPLEFAPPREESSIAWA